MSSWPITITTFSLKRITDKGIENEPIQTTKEKKDEKEKKNTNLPQLPGNVVSLLKMVHD